MNIHTNRLILHKGIALAVRDVMYFHETNHNEAGRIDGKVFPAFWQAFYFVANRSAYSGTYGLYTNSSVPSGCDRFDGSQTQGLVPMHIAQMNKAPSAVY